MIINSASLKISFNLVSARYLRPLGYAVDARYATKVASRNRNSPTS